MQEMMAVRNAMVRATDLRQPMDLGDQLMHRAGLANDVGQAMVNLLQVRSARPVRDVTACALCACSNTCSDCIRQGIHH